MRRSLIGNQKLPPLTVHNMLAEFKPLIRNHKFIFLWVSQVLSQITINIMNFILIIKLFETTGSTIATSLLWVAYAVPAMVIGPFAAASVDMFDRRKMLMVTNLLQSLTIVLYVFIHDIRLFLVYGVAMAYSFMNQFYVPAELASLPTLVKKPLLPQANGLFFLTQQAALILGFGAAGILSQTIGFEKTLYLCASFIFFAFLSVSLLPSMRSRHKVPRDVERAISKFYKQVIIGYRFIRGNKLILAPFLLLLTLQSSSAVVVVNIPALATQILNVEASSAGYYVVVPAGVGAAIGTLVVSKLLKRGWRKLRAIESFLALITLLFFVTIFVLPRITDIRRLVLGITVIMFIGMSFVGVLIPSQTFLQEVTPVRLRGRVFGNFWLLGTIFSVIPVIFSGTITELFGARILLSLLAAIALVALIFSKKYGQGLIEKEFLRTK